MGDTFKAIFIPSILRSFKTLEFYKTQNLEYSYDI